MFVAAKAMSLEDMKALLRNKQELLAAHSFISIVPPELRENGAGFDWPNNSERWLSLFFDDIGPEHLPMLPSLEEQYGRRLKSFGDEHADSVIKFLKDCHSRPEAETLYVNCVAGISRSGAVASFACEKFNLDRKQFLMANPHIMPNHLVLFSLRERWQLSHKPCHS